MRLSRLLATSCVALSLTLPTLPASAADWTKVAEALGKAGTEMPGGVYRVGLPRTDLRVTLDGVEVKPTLALGSWLAFQQGMGADATVMGDLVLLETEVGPVMRKLAEGGIQITALHNHLLRASPSTLYMHVLGQGDPAKLAAALHEGLVLSKTPLGDAAPSTSSQPSAAAAVSSSLEIDTGMIDRVLGAKGRANGGVYQLSLRRAEAIKDGGMEVPEAMGSAQAINFQPTGQGRAAITGDFVLIANEVNPVLHALREGGIEVTALHNHMLDDQPRLFFMHFWANDDAAKLARGLREALDKVNLAKS